MIGTFCATVYAASQIHGRQTLLVINDTDGSSFAAWQYVESTGGNEIAASELSLIGIFNANGTVSTSQFGFA
jgi:hypothetical protein